MISSITLDHFGAHENITIPLGQLTVVTGGVDCGKSWLVVRSLDFALFNNGYFHADDVKDEIRYQFPDGTKAPLARVRVDFTDGKWLERTRSSSRNEYRIFDGTTLHEYSSVGAGFFAPVGEHLGIQPVALDGRNPEVINIHGYHDPVFLLSRSPGQIDTVLSRLMGGAVFEDAANLVAADLRGTKAASKSLEQRAVETQAAIDELPDLSRAQALLDEAGRLHGVADAAVTTREHLSVASERLCRVTGEVLAKNVLVTRLRRVVEAAAIAVQNVANYAQVHALCLNYVERSHQIGRLRRVIHCAGGDLSNAEHLMERAEHCINLCALHRRVLGTQQRATQLEATVSAEQVKLSATGKLLEAATTSLGAITNSTQRIDLLTTLKNRLLRYTSAVTTETTLLTGLAQAVDNRATEFEQALRSAGHCPLCGSDTTQAKVA